MNNNSAPTNATACKKLLYILVTTLVFEGLVRKVAPSIVDIIVFFLKDVLCVIGVYYVLNSRLSKLSFEMATIWRKVFLAFFPLIVYSFFLDPPLGLFGTKQYMLYVVVALLVPTAFPQEKVEELKRFFLYMAILLIPTTVIATIQISLPATHWLNLSANGETMEGFSAAGRLRVSSTFSFTGQYSFYLNAATSFFVASFFMKARYKYRDLQKFDTLLLGIIGIMLIIGSFITGGRTAVLGGGACLFIGFLLTGSRYPSWFITKGIAIVFFGFLTLSAIRVVKPEYFEAYDLRASDKEEETHAQEVEGRVFGSFTSWTGWFFDQDVGPIVIGQGLGVMSNGSQQISSYASEKRSNGYWMETDLATTLWEGGAYLGIIWYVLRGFMMFHCYRLWKQIKTKSYASAAAFILAYVIVLGINGTLGIQPPMAIWWWMSIGSIIAIRQCDAYRQQNEAKQKAISTVPSEVYTNEEIISV